jgi:hypothetical protein
LRPSALASPPRGAALPLALILLGVLTVIAVASVSLSGRERASAAAYSRVDFMTECANAAQAKLWAEMAYGGQAIFGASLQVAHVQLPDGTRITSPAHFGWTPGSTVVKDVVLKVQSSAGAGGDVNERDCTNSACGLVPLGATHLIVAHCVDRQDRELELELAVKFAL